MKEIGDKLREAREKMEITIEEASEDLKVEPSIIEKIESGDKESFKNVLYLKYYIRDYAKYLGLNSDELVEEFNEYLFDYTSKISIDDIKNANKSNESKKVSQVVSPYTVEKKQQRKVPMILIYALIILIVGIIIYCLVLFLNNNSKNSDNIISYNEEVLYEFA